MDLLQFILGELRPPRRPQLTPVTKRAEEKQSGNHWIQFRSRTLRKKISVQTDLVDQLNFEFARNKNSMTVFMIRLRRVYQA